MRPFNPGRAKHMPTHIMKAILILALAATGLALSSCASCKECCAKKTDCATCKSGTCTHKH
ncbi:MAG TPA: hypothetical protein DIT64_21755 [Verrucomicrobiales bacterium]|nr:hypothetical protein [Verrucomicrobiales bacterium]